MTDFSKFLSLFPPPANAEKPDEKTIAFFKDKLPADLIAFWQQYGFGNYGNGMIKVINPEWYATELGIWLGRANDWSRIPILVSGFGDLFYYRRISDTDEDVSVVDIHYRRIQVCTDYVSYSLKYFFEDYITNEEYTEPILRKNLFKAALETKDNLLVDEVYFFVPALMLGSAEDILYVDKGKVNVHQQLLFQMGS